MLYNVHGLNSDDAYTVRITTAGQSPCNAAAVVAAAAAAASASLLAAAAVASRSQRPC